MEDNPLKAQRFLSGARFPATKEELIEFADKRGASENVRAILEGLPDEVFDNATEVQQALAALEG